MEIPKMDATSIGIISAGFATVTGAIGGVYKKLNSQLSECEKKHEQGNLRLIESQREMGEIRHRLGDLEGYVRAMKEIQSDQSGPPTPPPDTRD